MNAKGRLIVFEGADGIGKSTLAKALVDTLNVAGEVSEYLSFPGREEGTLGRLVYQLHHDSARQGVAAIEPASVQLLHIAAHIDAIKRRILPLLEEGRDVVLDRFWWSTWVYGLADGVSRRSLQLMLNLENLEWEGVVPTVAFLITRDAPYRPEVPQARFQLLHEHYSELAEHQKTRHPVEVVRNDRSLESAVEDIRQVLASLQHSSHGATQPELAFPKLPEERVKKN